MIFVERLEVNVIFYFPEEQTLYLVSTCAWHDQAHTDILRTEIFFIISFVKLYSNFVWASRHTHGFSHKSGKMISILENSITCNG